MSGHTDIPERKTLAATMLAQYRPLKYLRPEQKDILKSAWSLEQGYDGSIVICSFCKKPFPKAGINVHHCDGNDHHNEIENLAPACWDCNQKEKWVVRRREGAKASNQEREKISAGVGEATEEDLDKPAEIIKNEEGEPAFREFVIEHLLKFGPSEPTKATMEYLRPKNVINAASEWCGSNPKTCYPYLGRITNPINGFVAIVRHPISKIRYLKFRYETDYSLSAEEIMEMHPKEGLKARTEKVLKK